MSAASPFATPAIRRPSSLADELPSADSLVLVVVVISSLPMWCAAGTRGVLGSCVRTRARRIPAWSAPRDADDAADAVLPVPSSGTTALLAQRIHASRMLPAAAGTDFAC